MATYYKYAEREADSQINWAEIGKNMSDMLLEQTRIREEKKAEIDAASREFGETLSNPPQGENKPLNEWALQYADDYQQARLMQDKLLKSGQLKLKDYMVMRQNGIDGTKQAFDLINEYNQEYTSKMERLKNGDAQDLEAFLMQQAEGLANFNETKLYINPMDGRVSVGKMVTGEDGVKKLSTDQNDFSTVSSLRNRIKGKYDRFKSTEAVSGYVNGLGEEISTITNIKNKYQRGTITEILDITQRENFSESDKAIVKSFEEAETKMLNSFLSVPFNTTSILTNELNFDPKTNAEYNYTWSEEEAKKNSNLILLKNDPSSGSPMPQLSEEQKSNALEYLRAKARLMYDKKTQVSVVSANEPQKKTQTEIDNENAEKLKQSMLQNWQLVRNGTDEQKQAALDAIKGSPEMIARGLKDIYIQDDKVYFEYDNPKLNTDVDISNDANAFFRAGTEVFGAITEGELKKYATGDKITPTTELKASRGQEMNYQKPLETAVNNEGYIVEDNGPATANHLAAQFGKLGFTITGNTTTFGTDTITIKGGADGKTEATFNVDNQDQVNDIRDFIINNANPDKAQSIYGTKGSSSSKSSTSSKKGAGDALFKK